MVLQMMIQKMVFEFTFPELGCISNHWTLELFSDDQLWLIFIFFYLLFNGLDNDWLNVWNSKKLKKNQIQFSQTNLFTFFFVKFENRVRHAKQKNLILACTKTDCLTNRERTNEKKYNSKNIKNLPFLNDKKGWFL